MALWKINHSNNEEIVTPIISAYNTDKKIIGDQLAKYLFIVKANHTRERICLANTPEEAVKHTFPTSLINDYSLTRIELSTLLSTNFSYLIELDED